MVLTTTNQPSEKPARLNGPALPFGSSPRLTGATLQLNSHLVDIKKFSDIKSLDPVFENDENPWIEHCYKARKNLRYRELARENLNFTRTRRRSSTIVKLADILKILYLTRFRDVAPIRTRLALIEMRHRRQCGRRSGRWSELEFRRLVGSTRITRSEVKSILANPRVEVSREELSGMLAVLGRDDLDRPVWVPRRALRYLAAKGSRLEIASMLVLLARRMHGRFGRARVSAGLISRLVGAREAHITTALESLQERKLVRRNRQAERWSVNRWGSLWDFCEDLSIDPAGRGQPVRQAPKTGGVFRSLSMGEFLRGMQKGGDHINTDPTLQLEPQQPCYASELRARERAAAAAGVFERGRERRFYDRLRPDGEGLREARGIVGYLFYEERRRSWAPSQRRDDGGTVGEAAAGGASGVGGLCRLAGEYIATFATGEAPSLGYAEAVVSGLYGPLLEAECSGALDFGISGEPDRGAVFRRRLGLVGRDRPL